VRRALKYAGLSLAAVLTLLLVLLVWMLATASGSRWALGLVPGLQVDGFEGQLGGRWSAAQLRWQQGADQVLVTQPQFDWSPACLLRLTLCIDTLRSERIELNFAPSAEPPSEAPFSLPQLDLPVALQVGEVWIGSLQLNGDDQLQGLELAADWASDGLNISRLHVQRDELVVDLQGQVQPSGAWPLQLQGSAALPSPDGKAWDLKLQVEGNLRDSLALVVDSSGYLAGRLSGEVQPLVEHLPASLSLTADGFKPETSLPDTLRLNGVTLQAAGNLQDGYRVKGSPPCQQSRARLPWRCTGVSMQPAQISKRCVCRPGRASIWPSMGDSTGNKASASIPMSTGRTSPGCVCIRCSKRPRSPSGSSAVISPTTTAIISATSPPRWTARPVRSACRRRSAATCSRSTCHSCRCALGKAGSMASSPSASPTPCVGTRNCRSAISTPPTGSPSCPGASPGRCAARGSCSMGAWNSPATSTCKAACAASQRSCRPRSQAPVSVGI